MRCGNVVLVGGGGWTGLLEQGQWLYLGLSRPWLCDLDRNSLSPGMLILVCQLWRYLFYPTYNLETFVGRLNYLEWTLVELLKWSLMSIMTNENEPTCSFLEVDWECNWADSVLGGRDGNHCVYLILQLMKLQTTIQGVIVRVVGDKISRDCQWEAINQLHSIAFQVFCHSNAKEYPW